MDDLSFQAIKQYSWCSAVIIRGEMNTLQKTMQVHRSLSSPLRSHLSFYITLWLVLHCGEFASDETLQAVPLSPLEQDHVSVPCSALSFCLIYCNPVLTDIFCSNTRQPQHNNKPSHFLSVLVGGCGGEIVLTREQYSRSLIRHCRLEGCKVQINLIYSHDFISYAWNRSELPCVILF